jgi:hypothetical protein
MGSMNKPDVGSRINAIRQSFSTSPTLAISNLSVKSARKPNSSRPQRASIPTSSRVVEHHGFAAHAPGSGAAGQPRLNRSVSVKGLAQPKAGIVVQTGRAGSQSRPVVERPLLSGKTTRSSHGVAAHAPTVGPGGISTLRRLEASSGVAKAAAGTALYEPKTRPKEEGAPEAQSIPAPKADEAAPSKPPKAAPSKPSKQVGRPRKETATPLTVSTKATGATKKQAAKKRV